MLEASTAPDLAYSSSLPNTSFFTAMVSNTASMIRSASLTFSRPTLPSISAMRLAGASAGMPPRAAVASQFFCMIPMPRLSCSSAVSIRVTGIPALAKDIAMPPPMVPAPMMATRATLRPLVPSGTPAILAASRSAKKA